MKKTLFIIPLALVVFVCWAANDISFKQFVTEKYRSSTVTFDVNSKIQNDIESKTWDFKTTAGNYTVMRKGDIASGTFTNSTENLTGTNSFGITFSSAPTVIVTGATNTTVESVSTTNFTWSVAETNTLIRWIAIGEQ